MNKKNHFFWQVLRKQWESSSSSWIYPYQNILYIALNVHWISLKFANMKLINTENCHHSIKFYFSTERARKKNADKDLYIFYICSSKLYFI